MSFLTQPGPTFWPQKIQIWNYLNRILILNPLERQNFRPNFLHIWYFQQIWPSISTQVFLYPLLHAFECVLHAKCEENLIEMPVSLFFHNIGPNLVQTLPKDYTHFFFADFQCNMLEDSININNLCCNPVVLKKR